MLGFLFVMNEKKVVILYSDAKREYFPTEEQYITEAEVIERAKKIEPYFAKIGFVVDLMPGNEEIASALKKSKPDLF